jgi:tellurite resistance protein TehA-like permease
MEDGVLYQMLRQLLYYSPTMLVEIVALVLALMWMRRAKKAAILTIVGVAISLVTFALYAFLFAMVIQRDREQGHDAMSLSTQFAIIGAMSSLGRATGLAFIVAAIFVGRRAKRDPDRDDYRETPVRPRHDVGPTSDRS